MSLSSTSSAGPRAARLATAPAVAVAVPAPPAVPAARMSPRTRDPIARTGDERRGVDHLGPLTVIHSYYVMNATLLRIPAGPDLRTAHLERSGGSRAAR